MILTTTFVCFCLASAFNYFRTRRQRSLIKNLKGPFTWPLMGAMHKLLFLTPKNAELPFGSEIYINLYELQRNEERYPKANHFDAQRFLDSPPELLSYCLGPRCCPAKKFSMQLLKTLLAPILANFELLPYGDEVRLDLQLVLGSSNGFQLALKPR
ncbi:GD14021 [Drosophila simulans]|uniref:GD14021 n=1 Tax=Drosophila simulans TaxID=7240 RepID=B4QKF6_DROSI|nr:GD14021 [Drosophila simulans]